MNDRGPNHAARTTAIRYACVSLPYSGTQTYLIDRQR